MKWILLFALGGTAAVLIAACLMVLLLVHRVRRRNQVQPGTATGAPFHWLVSPQVVARLHRRLVAAARTARLLANRHRPAGRRNRKAEPPTIVRLCEELEAQAVALDRQLASVVQLPVVQRRAVLVRLAAGVGEVERTAGRLSVMSAEMAAPRVLAGDDDGGVDLSHHLDALESAEEELRQIEAGCGLDSVTPLRSRDRQPEVVAPEQADVPRPQAR